MDLDSTATLPAESTRAELGTLLRLALPITIAQVGLVTMGLVDTAIIGRLSVRDLAGTAIGRSIVFTASAIGMGVSYALEPLGAQAIGAGDPGRAWAALRSTLVAGALVTLPCIGLAFAATALLEPIGVDADLAPVARAFLLGHAPGLLAFTAFLAGKTFLQAHGETRPALVATVVANVLNAVVCSVLVHGDDALGWAFLPPLGLPRLGAFGAGLATSIASVVLAVIVLAAARRHRPAVPPPAVPLRAVLALGMPIGLQLLAEIGVFSLVSVAAGRLGAASASANQVAFGLVSFTFMGVFGVGGATAVRVGHAIGAGRSPRRSGLLGLGLGVSIMAVSALVFATCARGLAALFTPDEAVIDIAVRLIYVAAFFQIFDGLQAVAAGALRGAGDVRFQFLANLGAHWLVGLPIALTFGFGLGYGAVGLWFGLTAGLATVALLLTTRFLHVAKSPSRPLPHAASALAAPLARHVTGDVAGRKGVSARRAARPPRRRRR